MYSGVFCGDRCGKNTRDRPERAVEAGHKLVSSWFERLLVCRSSGIWPPYVQRIAEIDVPDNEVALAWEEGE